jgi:hypothetical protein
MHPLRDKQLDLIRLSLRAIKKKISLLLNLAKKGHIDTDFWSVWCYLPFSVGQNLTFSTFQEKQSYTYGQNCQMAKSSEIMIQKNSLKGCDSPSRKHPPTQKNKWRSDTWNIFKGLHKWGDFSRCRWSQLCQTSKLTNTERFFKGALTHMS